MIETSREAYRSVHDSGVADTQVNVIVDLVTQRPGLVYDEYARILRDIKHPEKALYDPHATMKRLCDAKKRKLLEHGYRVLIPGNTRRKSTWFPIWMVARMDMPLDCGYGPATTTIHLHDENITSTQVADEETLKEIEDKVRHVTGISTTATIMTASGPAIYKRHSGGVWILQVSEGEQNESPN